MKNLSKHNVEIDILLFWGKEHNSCEKSEGQIKLYAIKVHYIIYEWYLIVMCKSEQTALSSWTGAPDFDDVVGLDPKGR